MAHVQKLFFGCFALFAIMLNEVGGSFDSETTLTGKEFRALEKFKSRVIPKIPPKSLVQKYAKDDLYMVRWLRAKNLDVAAAEQMFLNHLKWREEEKIDTIDQEDFSDVKRDFPTFIDTFGKGGEPIIEYWFSEFHVRKIVLSGRAKRATRWIARGFEMNSRRLYDARAEGKEVAQGYALIDAGGFNLVEHACPACLSIYVNIVQLFESHYPGMYDRFYLTDMPPSFNIILRLLRPLMSRESQKALTPYVSQAEWMPELDKRIDKSQRGTQIGGTIARSESL